jgi:hypothetical protein
LDHLIGQVEQRGRGRPANHLKGTPSLLSHRITSVGPQYSNGSAPSVDGEFCAVNETGTIRRQKDNGFRNHKANFEDDVIGVCAGLWNFVLSY